MRSSIISQIKEDEIGGSCSMHEHMRNAYKIMVGKPEGKRPLGRPKRSWKDNIKMAPGEIGWQGVD
jgi:hypothetical protein